MQATGSFSTFGGSCLTRVQVQVAASAGIMYALVCVEVESEKMQGMVLATVSRCGAPRDVNLLDPHLVPV